jgi:hypothetical protein
LDRPQRPFFCPGVRGIDEGFGQIDFPAVAQVLREALEQPIESATALPELKSAMAGLVRRIAAREIGPRSPGAQHPEHAVEHRARINPRPAAPIGTAARPKRRFEYGPLGVGEVHAVAYDGHRYNVHHPVLGFMR